MAAKPRLPGVRLDGSRLTPGLESHIKAIASGMDEKTKAIMLRAECTAAYMFPDCRCPACEKARAR